MPRAAKLLADAEAAESEMLSQSVTPRGLLRLAVPMSFGVREVAPALPGFLAQYPQVSVDLHLSDETIDLIGGGYDAALRIASLPDSSLVARRLAAVPRLLVCAPCYLDGREAPQHPRDLTGHSCLSYAYLATPEVWHFTHEEGEQVSVTPTGQLKANNADALTPALFAGLGIALQPEFVVGAAVREGRLAVLLPDWQPPPIALHLVMPPGGPRPARVEALASYLSRYFSRSERDRAAPEALGIKE
jgi:DNA-binding transcriptional LysR family regulator